jgi:hypothetical protein
MNINSNVDILIYNTIPTFHLSQNKERKQLVYTKQNAMDYLIKNVFTSKKNKKSLQGYFESFQIILPNRI